MTKKAQFEQMTIQGFVNGKSFWNTVKPFLTSEVFFTNKNIAIEKKRKLINNNL